MSVSSIIFAVLFTSFAISYGWGMRGCIIGGEKGAMLPGALLGLLLARFSGIDVFIDNFWIFAAVGALSMSYGGAQTYGQTLGFVLHRDAPDYNKKKGYFALALKGLLWFGICGALLGMSFSAVTGAIYKKQELLLLFLTLPLIQFLGVKIFNTPYNKEKGVFPKIYFSIDRREEWGGNLILLAELIIFMLIKGDYFAAKMCLAGCLGGAVGWVVAIFLFDITAHRLKNGKYILGKAQENNFIDNWKIMEYALGAIGGFSISLCFCLNHKTILQYADIVNSNVGIWNALGSKGNALSWAAFGILFASLLIFAIAFIILRNRKIKTDRFENVFELVERALYSAIPLLLIMLGSINMAQLMSFFAIYWVLMEKICSEAIKGYKHKYLVCSVFAVTALLIFAGEIILGSYSIWITWLLYCGVYVAAEILRLFNKDRVKRHMQACDRNSSLISCLGSSLTVDAYFVFQALVLIILGYFIFVCK